MGCLFWHEFVILKEHSQRKNKFKGDNLEDILIEMCCFEVLIFDICILDRL